MKFDFEMRRARRKLMVAAFGLALCASGCTYFAEQPEVYPEKFAPAESDRAWMPRSNEYAIPMQARPASTLPEPRAASAGNKYDLPALIDIALSNNPDTRRDVGSSSRRRGCLRSLARAVLSSRQHAGSGWIRARNV